MRRRSRMSPARKLACALLAVAVVVSVVYATGAFTSTTASRSVDVNVAGDGSAFLSLQPSEGPNGKFASYGPNGALQVKIGGAAGPSPATGVNPDSTTVFKNVFTITNKGSQPVSVWLTDKNPAVTFIRPDGRSLEVKSGAVTIRPGGRSLHVGLVIDARGIKPGANLLQSVTIHTDTNTEGVSVARASSGGSGNSAKSGGSGSKDGNGGESTDHESREEGSNEQSGATGNNGGDGGDGNDDGGTDGDGGLIDSAVNTLIGFGKWAYDGYASVWDTVLFGLNEEVKKHVVNFIETAEAGFNDIKEAAAETLDAIKEAVTKKVNQLVSLIEKKYHIIKKHEEQLWDAVHKTPGFGDDILLWTVLHPDKVLEFMLGTVLGATGMPNGMLPVEQSNSPLYFVGWMAGSLVPGVSIVADIRDTVQAIANYNWGGAALGVVSIIPGLGTGGDFGQVGVYASKWLDAVPTGKAKELLTMVKKGFLSYVPNNVENMIMDALPDRLTKSTYTSKHVVTDRVPNSLKKYVDEGGYNGRQVNRLLDRGIPNGDMDYLLSKGVNLDLVRFLIDHGANPKHIDKIVKTGRNLQRIAEGVGLGVNARDWCQSRPKNKSDGPICQKVT